MVGDDGEIVKTKLLASTDFLTISSLAFRDDGLLLAGFSDYYAGKDRYAWIMLLGRDFSMKWFLALNGSGQDAFKKIAVTPEGYVYVAGYSNS